MKKLLPIFSILFMLGCEDIEDENSSEGGLTGSYLLSKASMDCDGMEDIWYVTVEVQSEDKIKVTDWDYMGDECDGSNDCYEKDSFVMTKDGNQYKVSEFGQIYTLEINGDGLKTTHTEDGFTDTQIWDRQSNSVKNYTPVCN